MRRIGLKLRAGLSIRTLIVALLILAVLPVVGGALFPKQPLADWPHAPLTSPVLRGPFVHQVEARGVVESANDVEIICDVSIEGFYSTRILELVPEGSQVNQGDFLAQLDSSYLEELRAKQQILCYTSEASLTQYERIHALAATAKRDYLDGTYRQQKLALDTQVVVATEKHRRATEYLDQSRRLYALGHITQRELEANEFAVRKARLELDSAQTKLDVLEDYTRPRTVKQLDCSLMTSEAKLKAAEYRHQRNLERLATLDEQIGNCLVVSPDDGQVNYAHLHHHGHSHMIEEGASVRRKQVIFRLPDPAQMRVKAMIREDSIALVEKGMPVSVELEAFPDVELSGCVERVEEYPEPIGFLGSSVKQFEAIIALDDYAVDLRPGLSAEVKVCVQRLSDQLLVPTQAVLEHGGRDYCITCDHGRLEAHEVETGSCDGRYVVIRSGLEEGSDVVLGTGAYRDKVGLPMDDRKS